MMAPVDDMSPDLRCPVCDQTYTGYDSYTHHMRKHSREQTFACSFMGCEATFTSEAALNYHSYTHPGYKAEDIENEVDADDEDSDQIRQIRTPAANRSDRDERDRRCQICKKMIGPPATLAIHMRVHTGERPFACQHQSCGKRFQTRSNLTNHMRVHSGEKQHPCMYPDCGMRFSMKSGLTTHIRTHTGEQPFACTHDGCGMRFSANSNLNRHLRSHAGGAIHNTAQKTNSNEEGGE